MLHLSTSSSGLGDWHSVVLQAQGPEGWESSRRTGLSGLFPRVMGTRTVSGSKGPQRATGHLLKGTTHRGAFGRSGQSGVEAFSWWRPGY